MMARRDKENDHSVLNETGTTHQDSFFDESCSSLLSGSISIGNGSGIARIPSSQPRQQQRQQLRLLEQQEKMIMMVTTPRINKLVMGNSICPAPTMSLPVEADLMQQQEQQKLLLLLPIPLPEIRRVSLEDALAVTAQQRQHQSQRSHRNHHHHRHNHTAMTRQRIMLVGNNATNECCQSMYDINGSPMVFCFKIPGF